MVYLVIYNLIISYISYQLILMIFLIYQIDQLKTNTGNMGLNVPKKEKLKY